MNAERKWIGSGVKWEELCGYARAVRVGDRILVSATSASGPDGVVASDDPAEQTRFIIGKIEKALLDLGSELGDVVLTRIYLRNINDWQPVAMAHGEVFRNIRPANTLVEAGFVGDEILLEMEAEAVVGSKAENEG
jgi:enamine deaminase RidA (YjgF/YER057c/UK114 family)